MMTCPETWPNGRTSIPEIGVPFRSVAMKSAPAVGVDDLVAVEDLEEEDRQQEEQKHPESPTEELAEDGFGAEGHGGMFYEHGPAGIGN